VNTLALINIYPALNKLLMCSSIFSRRKESRVGLCKSITKI